MAELLQPIKAILSDIDGTLLNKDRVLSPLTVDTIKKIRTLYDVPFVLISARMPKAITHLAAQLGINDPIVAYNGGLIFHNTERREVVQNLTISTDVAYEVYSFLKESNVHISLFREDEWVAETEDYWAKREINNTRVTPALAPVEQTLERWARKGGGVHKIMCMGDAHAIGELEHFMRREHAANANSYRSKDTYLEITPTGTNKALAMHKVLAALGVDAANAAAFGDNYNDVEMLREVGVGVAMGNAPEKVKKAANVVARHHKEDGVAHELIHLFGLGEVTAKTDKAEPASDLIEG
ncbi:Cof-type HAD-IIB family hydrolase [uncultured Acetobacteroides sp.]|uniref:Cof-type HAD-IIB family hydrolase n=1 Tax=uncultured Acetobacteroides sp. TaxID=1760811 RepID=UPI0029F58161|nr:Cof-type HAD-IIB family hydrolase [uncultured Acetobacteroides sp.]